MSNTLSAIWTTNGLDKLAAQLAGGDAVTIKTIALGDGGGSMPSVQPSVTALYSEKWRGNVNTVEIDPDSSNSVIVEAVIPYNVGGWYIREWGLFDTDGDLIAYGPHAEFYKPVLESGTGAELLERIRLPVTSQSQINMSVSSDVLATRDYVDDEVSKLETALTAHSGDADTHVNLARKAIQIIAGTGLSGGGTLEANRTLSVVYGTSAGTACQGNDTRLSTVATQSRNGLLSSADKKALDFCEALRKSWIGVPRPWRSTTLLPGHVWANGSFVLFEDYPELEEVYNANGFAGMLLAYDADEETIAANLGKWRPNSAKPTGLYTPSLGGQFSRAWVPGQSADAGRGAGSWQQDAVETGITAVYSEPQGHNGAGPDFYDVTTTLQGNVSLHYTGNTDSWFTPIEDIGVQRDHYSYSINQRYASGE